MIDWRFFKNLEDLVIVKLMFVLMDLFIGDEVVFMLYIDVIIIYIKIVGFL